MKNFIPGEINMGSYIPYPLDKGDLESDKWSFSNMETIHMMNIASNMLGKLNGLAAATPNISNYIKMFTLSEATAKFNTDGINIGFDDFLCPESHVRDYTKFLDAWHTGHNMANILREMPEHRYTELDEDSLCEMHFKLLKDAGVNSVYAGDYRTSTVAMPEMTADACPPDVIDLNIYCVLGAEESEGFCQLPELARTALLVMQFEALQPFEIENNTMARLLITKWLIQYGILDHPILPVFRWLHENEEEWRASLQKARTNNDAELWVEDFMMSIYGMASLGIEMLKKARKVEAEINEKMKLLDAKQLSKAQLIMPELWEKGCISINRTMELTKTSFPTASKLLLDMEKQGIVGEWTGGTRNKEYGINDYVQMFLMTS